MYSDLFVISHIVVILQMGPHSCKACPNSATMATNSLNGTHTQHHEFPGKSHLHFIELILQIIIYLFIKKKNKPIICFKHIINVTQQYKDCY